MAPRGCSRAFVRNGFSSAAIRTTNIAPETSKQYSRTQLQAWVGAGAPCCPLDIATAPGCGGSFMRGANNPASGDRLAGADPRCGPAGADLCAAHAARFAAQIHPHSRSSRPLRHAKRFRGFAQAIAPKGCSNGVSRTVLAEWLTMRSCRRRAPSVCSPPRFSEIVAACPSSRSAMENKNSLAVLVQA